MSGIGPMFLRGAGMPYYLEGIMFTKVLATLVLGLCFVVNVEAGTQSHFPVGPDLNVTPGSFCTHPDTYRYPEHIAYCERDVASSLKQAIIRQYNEQLGFDIRANERGQFKIDHLIPLCAGGSNNQNNLWPQHQSVYVHTDMIEQVACEKMAEGKVQQKTAVEMILTAKHDLSKADDILRQFQAM
jgi:hypothetical protein